LLHIAWTQLAIKLFVPMAPKSPRHRPKDCKLKCHRCIHKKRTQICTIYITSDKEKNNLAEGFITLRTDDTEAVAKVWSEWDEFQKANPEEAAPFIKVRKATLKTWRNHHCKTELRDDEKVPACIKPHIHKTCHAAMTPEELEEHEATLEAERKQRFE
jgi:hypothetical protein